MTNKGWVWDSVLGIFWLGLIVLAVSFHIRISEVQTYQIDESLDSEFRGNDWVSWVNTSKGVVAERVHPLPGYKPNSYYYIKPGDRILKLDYTDITKSDVADRITASAPPGHRFTAIIQQANPFVPKPVPEKTFLTNGFHLTFTFNEFAAYWYMIIWIVGIGAFVAFVMLAILFPVIRGNWREYISLMGVVSGALLFFLVLLMRHLYLIIESDLQNIGFEKTFILAYLVLLFIYIINYFYFKSRLPSIYYAIPSIAVGGYILGRIYQIVYIDKELKFFHDLVEDYSALFFLLHLAAGIVLFVVAKWNKAPLKSLLPIMSIGFFALMGIAYFSLADIQSLVHREHVWFPYNLLLFFPLINAAFLQLQFGKVSLVVTRTIQYLVFFILSIILYLAIIQLFNYLPGIQYRRILEFITFAIVVLLVRLIYMANERRVSKYFVTAQRERLNKFKSFIAQIPQYHSSAMLRKDLVDKISEFFNSETVHFWWNADEADSDAEKRYHNKQEEIYRQLDAGHSVWSKAKEIASFRLETTLEKDLYQSPYTLVCPVTVDQEHYALLMLGKKKRGVYNLSDLELISQLVQQTQLTLNVLQLVAREKELIQQTYEANLTALRSQINPHFLFNTLNSIGELVHESADLAEQAVEKLAFIFRYTLNKSSQNFVALSDEIKLISTYLDLEKIRFGDRLDIHIAVSPDIREVQIPAFILMTLTENCIKHGIAKILNKGIVSVECFQKEDELICEVYDSGPGIDLTRIYKSTGLSNSIARLENIYDQKNLLYFENTGDGTLVRMRIPLK